MRERHPFKRIGLLEIDSVLARHNLIVLDVRDSDSFEESHIDGAHHASHANVSTLLGHLAKTVPILIYCYHGNASQEYAQIFSDFGFIEVYSLDGGYEAWRNRAAGK